MSVGSQVETGAPLLRLEPLADGDAGAEDTRRPRPSSWTCRPRRGRSRRGSAPRAARRTCAACCSASTSTRTTSAGCSTDYLAARRAATEAGQRPLADELELLDVFADLAELSRNRPAGEDGGGDGHVHSAREYFHTYLQSLDVERAGLPEAFQARLAKALGHYGVTELERSPELEAAVFRIFLAQQRASTDAAVVAALLRAWLREPPPDETLREPAGLALERLVAATQVRFPVVVRPRPRRGVRLVRPAAAAAQPRPRLRRRPQAPALPGRAARTRRTAPSASPRWCAAPSRWCGCSASGSTATASDNAVMLEVLTRRYYGNKGITGVRTREVAGCTFVVAERADSRVVSVGGELRRARHARCAGSPSWRAARTPSTPTSISPGRSSRRTPTRWRRALHEVVSAHPLPSQVRRLTTTVAGRGGAVMHHHFTFRPSATGMTEERLIRGLHPYIAQRMQLERLRKFDLTRLPSSDEEVYLFQCVARDNPSDDRLVAFAQVRDLTELREHDGRLVALPTAEDTIATCLDSIRRAQSRRPSKKRFNTNRIVVYVWPPSDITRAELEMIAGRVLPTTAGAGLEEILFIARQRDRATGELTKIAVRISFDATGGSQLTVGEPPVEPVEPLDDYRQKVLRASSRNTVYPYELTGLLGDFTEHDLDDDHALVPVDRPKGHNSAAIVAGVVTTPTERHPRGRHPGGAARRPDEVARRAVGAGVPPRDRRAGPGRAACGCRWSGTRCPPAPGSRWSRARRTWTGWPRRSSGSSSSPRTAARSTSWSRASTSARSRTGTPRRRCSCTPRASW